MIIKLTKKDLDKITKFCEDVCIARRGRDIANKDQGSHRIDRQKIGIFGEVAAQRATGIGEVDFKIYKNGEVHDNCDYDLAPNVHVKTASSKYKGTKFDGWLISKKEKVFTNPAKDDIIILCYAGLEGTVDVVGFVYAIDVKPLFRPPVNKSLAHKSALYAEDIVHLLEDLEDMDAWKV